MEGWQKGCNVVVVVWDCELTVAACCLCACSFGGAGCLRTSSAHFGMWALGEGRRVIKRRKGKRKEDCGLEVEDEDEGSRDGEETAKHRSRCRPANKIRALLLLLHLLVESRLQSKVVAVAACHDLRSLPRGPPFLDLRSVND